MYIIQAGVKLVAVLGIALITVLLVVAMVYLLIGAKLSEEEGAVTRPTTREIPANAVEPDTLAKSEQRSQAPARDAGPEDSVPVSESLITPPEAPTSEPDTSISAPKPLKESHPGSTRDSSSDADARPKLAAEAAPNPTHSSSTSPKLSSDETGPEPSPPSQTVLEPADVRYYTVKEGDTLYSIARQVYGEGKYWKVIYDANKNLIKDPVKLKLQWKLELPPLQ